MLVPHIDSCLDSHSSAILRYSDEDQFEMAEKIALVFEENGRLKRVNGVEGENIRGTTDDAGQRAPWTLRAMGILARSYLGLRRYQRAMELLEHMSEKNLGSEGPGTLSRMYALATCYSNLGRQQEAMDLRAKTLEAMQRTLGSEHPDTLRTMASLANSYSDLGRQQEAMDLLEKTLEATQRTLGSEHPDTLTAMINLAASYSDLGRQQEAMGLREKTLEATQRTLGSDHPDTLTAMINFCCQLQRSRAPTGGDGPVGEDIRGHAEDPGQRAPSYSARNG